MQNEELVFLKPRARNMRGMMYIAGIAVKGTEETKTPQIVVYSSHPAVLQILVADHNEMVKLRKAKPKSKDGK